MKAGNIFNKLHGSISTFMDEHEAKAISYLILEHLCGLSRTDVIAGQSLPWNSKLEDKLTTLVRGLKEQVPIQYLLKEADFFGRKFMVDERVLIPRQETEELVDLIIKDNKGKSLTILDVGTGSGCIAITLALELKQSQVFATDISSDALILARSNAEKLNADVEFKQHDLFDDYFDFEAVDVLVSNPPYIPIGEKSRIPANVINHEPDSALMADQSGLLFYKRLATMAKFWVKPEGKIYFEIHENKAKEIKALLVQNGLVDISIIKDLNKKYRFAVASLPVF